jgi:hypothetical protein
MDRIRLVIRYHKPEVFRDQDLPGNIKAPLDSSLAIQRLPPVSGVHVRENFLKIVSFFDLVVTFGPGTLAANYCL